MHFHAEKRGFLQAHGRKPQELAEGFQLSRARKGEKVPTEGEEKRMRENKSVIYGAKVYTPPPHP